MSVRNGAKTDRAEEILQDANDLIRELRRRGREQEDPSCHGLGITAGEVAQLAERYVDAAEDGDLDPTKSGGGTPVAEVHNAIIIAYRELAGNGCIDEPVRKAARDLNQDLKDAVESGRYNEATTTAQDIAMAFQGHAEVGSDEGGVQMPSQDPVDAIPRKARELEQVLQDVHDDPDSHACRSIEATVDTISQDAIRAVKEGDWKRVRSDWFDGVVDGMVALLQAGCIDHAFDELRVEQIERVAEAATDATGSRAEDLVQVVRTMQGELSPSRDAPDSDSPSGQTVVCAAPGSTGDIEEWLDQYTGDYEIESLAMAEDDHMVTACAVIRGAVNGSDNTDFGYEV